MRYPTIDAEIARYRATTGKGKKEIAEQMQINYNTLLAKLSGKKIFTIAELQKLSEILDVQSLDYLVGIK